MPLGFWTTARISGTLQGLLYDSRCLYLGNEKQCRFLYGFDVSNDYNAMTLFDLKTTLNANEDYSDEHVLNCVFGLNRFSEGKAQYTLDVSPFANDTPEIERKRWLQILPAHVLDDTNRRSYHDGSGSTRRSWWAWARKILCHELMVVAKPCDIVLDVSS